MKRILSIDGGGIRGILPTRLLQAIEEKTGKSIASQFDMIAGTSTGGIIACGLVRSVPPATLLGLYTTHGTDVFHRNIGMGLLEPKYLADKLEALLKVVLGVAKLSDVIGPELLVPSYCVQPAGSFFFRSWKARVDASVDFPLWQVARATSAAPTYFPTASLYGRWMVDGGVFANNPALCAAASAYGLWPSEDLSVLSLGTGTKVTDLNGAASQGWGLAQWGPEAPAIFMDGAADSVSYICETVLDEKFMRCDIGLVGVADAFDDASPLNIANLGKLADKFVADNLTKIVDFLK